MIKKVLLFLVFATVLINSLTLQAQNVWRHRACFPGAAREYSTQFIINNKAYLVGGSPSYSSTAVADVWAYDPALDSWSQKNNFPTTIAGGFAFVINGIAYLGMGSPSSGGQPYYTAYYKYDENNDKWIALSDFPGTARYVPMSFVIGDTGYIACGKSVNSLNDCWKYDPQTDSWNQIANFPGSARSVGYGATVNNLGYVGLGISRYGAAYDDSYAYNPQSGKWTQIADFPGTRWGVSSFVINDTLYVACGQDSGYAYMNAFKAAGAYNADCWRYDVSSNLWIEEPDFLCIAPPRRSVVGFAISNHGYVFGGGRDSITVSISDLLEFGPFDAAFTTQVNVLGRDTNYCNSFNRQFSVYDSCAVWSTGAVGSSIIVSSPGTYWVRLNDSCGVSADTIHIAQTNILPGDSIENATCGLNNGAAGIYVVGGTPPFKFLWSNGDTTSQLTNLASGIYVVTVSDYYNCSADLSITVRSSNIGEVIITSDSSSFCQGYGTQVCAPGGFSNYTWNTGQTTTCIYAQQGGNYYVTVSNGGDCSAESNHILLTELNATAISITVNGDTLACYSGIGYQWYFNGSVINGATDSSYIAKSPGDYSVLVTDSNGCKSESNGVEILSTGIDKPDVAGNISVYPNPAGNMLFIQTGNLKINAIIIYDINGGLMSRSAFAPAMDISALVSGVYILEMHTEQGTVRKLWIKD